MKSLEVLYELLRSALWGRPASVDADFKDWDEVFAVAKSQSVLALVGHAALNSASVREMLPAGAAQKLKAFVMANVATHNMLNGALAKVVSALDEASMEYVLLKGQGLARNYPVPELRACGDIDLYVGSENYLKACQLLGAMASSCHESSPMDEEKHYDVRIGKATVEIHRFSDVNPSTHYDRIYQKYSDEGLSRNVRVMHIAGLSVNTPADDFNAFYIFNHLWHHFMTSGIGLRQFCDWMLFLHNHKDEINLQRLESILKEMDMMKPWQCFGCILVEVLGMPAEDFPFYDKMRTGKLNGIMKLVIKEGNFGHERDFYKDRSKESYFEHKVKSLYYHTLRSLQLFRLFPSHTARQYMYMLTRGINKVWKDKVR
jgi:hypothetical protein